MSEAGRKASPDYHRKRGHILPIRRGLHWVVAPGVAPANRPVDPFLVGGHIRADAALACHSALKLHGRAYSSFNEVQFPTDRKIRPFDFRGTHYLSRGSSELTRFLSRWNLVVPSRWPNGAGRSPQGALDESEREFLDQLIDGGSIRPDLLKLEAELAAHLEAHPALQWRARQAQR